MVVVRLPGVRLIASGEGVVVRNLGRTRRFAWTDIEGFESGRRSLRMRTHGGRIAVEASWLLSSSERNDLATHLNEARAARGGAPATS